MPSLSLWQPPEDVLESTSDILSPTTLPCPSQYAAGTIGTLMSWSAGEYPRQTRVALAGRRLRTMERKAPLRGASRNCCAAKRSERRLLLANRVGKRRCEAPQETAAGCCGVYASWGYPEENDCLLYTSDAADDM
eukprot:4420929-Alexandrium_andersonii.AAC.1